VLKTHRYRYGTHWLLATTLWQVSLEPPVLPTLLLAGACCILTRAVLAIMLLVNLVRVTPRHSMRPGLSPRPRGGAVSSTVQTGCVLPDSGTVTAPSPTRYGIMMLESDCYTVVHTCVGPWFLFPVAGFSLYTSAVDPLPMCLSMMRSGLSCTPSDASKDSSTCGRV